VSEAARIRSPHNFSSAYAWHPARQRDAFARNSGSAPFLSSGVVHFCSRADTLSSVRH